MLHIATLILYIYIYTHTHTHTHTLYRILDDGINERKCCITRNDKWLLDREAA